MDESSCLQCDEAHGPCELHDTRRGYIARIRALEKDRDRVARVLSVVLGVSFEHARDLPEKCSLDHMLPLQRAEKAEADAARLREALRESLTHSHEDSRCARCDNARAALAEEEKP